MTYRRIQKAPYSVDRLDLPSLGGTNSHYLARVHKSEGLPHLFLLFSKNLEAWGASHRPHYHPYHRTRVGCTSSCLVFSSLTESLPPPPPPHTSFFSFLVPSLSLLLFLLSLHCEKKHHGQFAGSLFTSVLLSRLCPPVIFCGGRPKTLGAAALIATPLVSPISG